MKSKVSDYLIEKKALQESIDWYIKNLPILEEQHNARKRRLQYLQDRLYVIEKEFHKNG